jgi:hypothetical protein
MERTQVCGRDVDDGPGSLAPGRCHGFEIPRGRLAGAEPQIICDGLRDVLADLRRCGGVRGDKGPVERGREPNVERGAVGRWRRSVRALDTGDLGE